MKKINIINCPSTNKSNKMFYPTVLLGSSEEVVSPYFKWTKISWFFNKTTKKHVVRMFTFMHDRNDVIDARASFELDTYTGKIFKFFFQPSSGFSEKNAFNIMTFENDVKIQDYGFKYAVNLIRFFATINELEFNKEKIEKELSSFSMVAGFSEKTHATSVNEKDRIYDVSKPASPVSSPKPSHSTHKFCVEEWQVRGHWRTYRNPDGTIKKKIFIKPFVCHPKKQKNNSTKVG